MKKNIDKNTKQKIIALVCALIPNAKIYLFGSRARSTHSQWSDIDLALDTGEKISIVTVGEIIDVLAGTDIPYKIEVVDLNNIPEKMRTQILEEGILWKQ